MYNTLFMAEYKIILYITISTTLVYTNFFMVGINIILYRNLLNNKTYIVFKTFFMMVIT